MANYQGRYLQQQFGNYRLIKLLGYGGFAEVYLGEHVYMGTQAAIKILTTRLTPEEIAHFRNEARTIFGLEHPNIVRVLDYGLKDDIPYIIMNYAAKGSLRRLHPYGTKIPLPTIIEYVNQIASALQYAHDHNIIHRDIKPDNILIGSRGELLISDFGIAIISKTGRTSLQSFYDVGGTPYYMAPEAFRGKPEKASDQYSLGIMVYEWLCGHPPFTEGDIMQIGYQHNYEPIPPLRDQDLIVSSDVERIIMQSMAKSPKERYMSAKVFADTLSEVNKKKLTGTTLLKYRGHGDGWSAFAWSPNGKFIAVGNLVGDVQLWDSINWKFIRTCGEHNGRVSSITWSPDGRHFATGSFDSIVKVWDASTGQCLVSYAGHIDGVSVVAWSPDGRSIASVGSSLKSTIQVWNASTGHCLLTYADHRSFVNDIAWSPDGHRIASGSDNTVHVWDTSTEQLPVTFICQRKCTVNSVAWSPDGQRIASGSTGETVQIVQAWDASTGKCLFTYSATSSGNAVAWSPDGQRIASSGDGVQIWDANTGKCLFTYSGHIKLVDKVVWSPDGQCVASGSFDGSMQVWDASTGQRLFIYAGHADRVRSLSWSPDGQRIASSGNETVQVWNTSTGECVVSFFGHTDDVNAVAWSPDGRHIASGSFDKTVQVWDANTGQRLVSYTGHTAYLEAVVWSPDGQLLASASYNQTVQVWNSSTGQWFNSYPINNLKAVAWFLDGCRLASALNETVEVWDASTGQCLVSYTGHGDDIHSVAWSPDGKRIASSSYDHTVQIWDSSTGKCLLTYTGHMSCACQVAWSPDGRYIASSSLDGSVQIWHADTGQCLVSYKGHADYLFTIVWSPDGKRVASGVFGVVHIWQLEAV